jgi:uncharacterized protein (DUF1330 family)
MAKGYWVVQYRFVKDPAKLEAYAKLAGAALGSLGARPLVRGVTAVAHEAGLKERTVVLEFESLEAATAAYESPAYAEALAALGDGAERDFRIIGGFE